MPYIWRFKRWLRLHNDDSLRLFFTIVATFFILAIFAALNLIDWLASRGYSPPASPQIVEALALAPALAPSVKVEARHAHAAVASAMSESNANLSGVMSEIALDPPFLSVDGTTLLNGQLHLKLAEIEGPSAFDTCLDASGLRWSCGLQARAALHNMLAGSALACRADRAIHQTSYTVRCRLIGGGERAGRDLSALLVEAGWARALPGASEALKAASAHANARGHGLWRGNWQIVPLRP